MKSFLAEWTIIGLVFVLVFPALTGAQPQVVQANIAGEYVLFREGDLNGHLVGRIRIELLQNNKFVVGISTPTGDPAVDWQGKGVLKGNSGYYNWVFDDGKKGQTTFSIDSLGHLHGQVRGTGTNWDYVAKKTTGTYHDFINR